MSNPYADLKDFQFWRRSVSVVEPHLLDPVITPKFAIGRETRVSTAGSCFAQHISKTIKKNRLHYFVTEDGSGLGTIEATKRNFGVFSARYGNIYTTQQLLQIFEEAFDGRAPLEVAWQRSDGRYVDPYRPQIEPDGFATEGDVVAARQTHLGFVRRVFRETHLLIFTLGLTESWRSRRDGFVFPLAPGVVGGRFDPDLHEFVNFDVINVLNSLMTLLHKLKTVNPTVKVLLTVSPVPLIATYEDRHVLVSTVYSKSVLRVAADMATRAFDWVDYFPSYEIITSSSSGGAYYADDYREVTPLGVAHAMRSFVKHYVAEGNKAETSRAAFAAAPVGVAGASEDDDDVICDEEALDAIRI